MIEHMDAHDQADFDLTAAREREAHLRNNLDRSAARCEQLLARALAAEGENERLRRLTSELMLQRDALERSLAQAQTMLDERTAEVGKLKEFLLAKIGATQ